MRIAGAEAFRRGLRSLWGDRRGNFAVLTAIAALPVMFTVGGAVDLNMYYTNRTKIQNATDAAALAAAKRFPFDPDEARLKRFALDYFEANAGDLYRTTTALDYKGVKFNENNVRELTIEVNFGYKPVFLPMMVGQFAGMDGKLDTVASVVAIGNTTVEMAMVLDTSGSMNDVPKGGGGSKIAALRTIASDAVDQLFGSGQMAGVEDPVRVSVVPFAGSVNLGRPLDSWWLDPKGLHPNHHDHLDWDRYNYTAIPADYREPAVGQAGSASWTAPQYQANQIAIRDPNSSLPLNQRPWVRRDDHSVYLTRQYILANTGQMGAPSFDMFACPLSRPTWRNCVTTGSNGSFTVNGRVGLALVNCRQGTANADALTCHPPYTQSRSNQFYPQAHAANPRVCAEARTGKYDLTAKVPDERDPESLFMPYFAPDEYVGGGLSNNYLEDASWVHPLRIDGTNAYRPLDGQSWDLRQKDVRKYLMQPVRLPLNNTTNNLQSPFFICESDAVVGLANTPNAARTRVASLNATGATNVEEGLAWGWRTVTPGEPFAGARPYGDENNFKAVVVMTDGANTYYQASSSENYSAYGAYGFSRDQRIFRNTNLNTGNWASYANAEMTRAMDQRTARLCENVKNDNRVPVKTASGDQIKDGSGQPVTRDGVIIYTIAFDIPASDKARVDKLLRDCASAAIGDQMAGKPLANSTKYFYSAASNADLKKAFSDIVASLSSLRIAR